MRREPALALPEEAQEESARWGEEDRGERARAASGFWGETPSYRSLGIRLLGGCVRSVFIFFLVWVGVRYIFLFLASQRCGGARYTYF